MANFLLRKKNQANSACERALYQLTVCFEIQDESERGKRNKSCALQMVFKSILPS